MGAGGAGLSLVWHPPEGYVVEAVEPVPGQRGLRPGDVLRRVGPAALGGHPSQAAADAALATALKVPVGMPASAVCIRKKEVEWVQTTAGWGYGSMFQAGRVAGPLAPEAQLRCSTGRRRAPGPGRAPALRGGGAAVACAL